MREEIREMGGTYRVIGEGRELLDAADRDVRDAALLARLQQREVHLARAQDVALDVFGRSKRSWVRLGDVAFELGLADHLFEVRASKRVAQEALREEED